MSTSIYFKSKLIPYLDKTPINSHRRRTETKLTKADAAAGIHYCNGALQNWTPKKSHHKSDGNRFKKVLKFLLNHDVTRKIFSFQILNFQNFFKNFFHRKQFCQISGNLPTSREILSAIKINLHMK